MKNIYLMIAVLIFFSMLLLPMAALPTDKSPASSGGGAGSSSVSTEKVDEFDIYNHVSGEVQKIKAADYVFGVVASEMSVDSNEEALKAQAVVAYTFACRKRMQRLEAKNSGQDYDLTTNPQLDQGYISRDDAMAKWGDKGSEYAAKLDGVVKAVSGYVITYEGKPIMASYHAISAGKTESAANVWGTDYPYLQPVESVGDLLAPGYLSTVTVSADDFKSKLTELGAALSGEPATWIIEPKRSQSGTVLTYTVGGKDLAGKDLRTAFSLRSANFDLAFADGNFTFTVRGYGHGVGMSQYGANYMAGQGSTFLEILSWYYPGCQLASPK